MQPRSWHQFLRSDGLLLGLIGILALAFSVVLAPFQLADEHAHFLRAYEITNGHLLGRSAPDVAEPVVAVIQRYPEMFDSVARVAPSKVWADLTGRISPLEKPQPLLPADSGHRYLAWGIVGTNLYSPVGYLPAAVGIGIARLLGASALAMLYAGRFANVVLFTAAMALVFRLAPERRAFFTALALLPMTLHQVGGVSGDVATIAAAFVGLSMILAMRNGMRGRGFWIGVAIVFGLWMTCKPSPWALAVVLLIPPSCFARRRSWILYMAAVAAVMVACAAVWQAASHASMETFQAARLSSGIDVAANARYVTAHPLEIARSIVDFASHNYRTYLGQMAGVFGWKRVALPIWMRMLYLAVVILVAIVEPPAKNFTKWERLLLLGVFLAGAVFIHVAMFISDGTWCDPNGAGGLCFSNSAGIQGRYFIPFGIFGLAALQWRRMQVRQSALLVAVIGAGGLYAEISLLCIWNAFYR